MKPPHGSAPDDGVDGDGPDAGPLPSPELLAEYERVLPGATEQILRMTAAQAAHRRALEATLVARSEAYARRGQELALVLLSLVAASALLLGLSGGARSTAFAGILTAIVSFTASVLAAFRRRSAEGGGESRQAGQTVYPPRLARMAIATAAGRAAVRASLSQVSEPSASSVRGTENSS